MKGKPGARATSRTPAKSRKPKPPRPSRKSRSPARASGPQKPPSPRGPRSGGSGRAAASRTRRAANAEDDLLNLARSLTVVSGDPAADGTGVEGALLRLEAAWAGGGPLPRRFFQSWLRTRNDKTATLALAWAREQVRRALTELLERERVQGGVRTDVASETLSWLVLAGSEALAHEPLGASRDRVAMMLEFLRPPEKP